MVDANAFRTLTVMTRQVPMEISLNFLRLNFNRWSDGKKWTLLMILFQHGN